MANFTSVLKQLQQERNRLKSQIESVKNAVSALKGPGTGRTNRGTISAAGRARIAAAQRARWAKAKARKVALVPARKGRTISPAARRRIATAQKARWAKWRKSQKKG